MKNRLTFLFGLLWLLALAVPCVAKEWKTIYPLQTTRAEAIKLLGTPLKGDAETGEYFKFENDLVKISWRRADCYEDSIIKEASISPDALVNQITVEPEIPLDPSSEIIKEQQIDSPVPEASPANSVRPVYKNWISKDINCSVSGNGAWENCSILDSQNGFGYSTSKGGIVALYYYPGERELAVWKTQQKPCSLEQK